jgi:hypothetical protein
MEGGAGIAPHILNLATRLRSVVSSPDILLPVHPLSYPMGNRGSFRGGKAAGAEDDHSPPSSAEVKNGWSYTSTPPIRLHGVVLS